MQRVGIVIVTYNSEAEIGPCLDAAIVTGAQVLVVDNASSDGTCDAVRGRGVRLIANHRNAGFAAAVNQGVRCLATPLILLLNPDAVIVGGVAALARQCESPGVAGAGGKLLGADGRPQVGFMARRLPSPLALICEALLVNRAWPSNPVNWNYRCLDLDCDAPCEVEQPAGAFFMIRRDVWQALDGFDERFYPLWFEDVDFCKRARERGFRLYYVSEAVAKHTGGHSIPKIPLEKRRLYWYGSFLRYTARHFGPLAGRMVCAAVVTGSILRMSVEMISSRSLRPAAVYGKVVRLTLRYFFSGWGR